MMMRAVAPLGKRFDASFVLALLLPFLLLSVRPHGPYAYASKDWWTNDCGIETTTASAVGLAEQDTVSSCIDVDNDWNRLRIYMERTLTGSMLVFCPFTVIAYDAIRPRTEATFVCSIRDSCVIQGTGTHLIMNNKAASITIAGFRLEKATRTALRVMAASVLPQSICHCTFIDNHVDGRGAAIRTEKRTTIHVLGSTFKDNTALRGGAIYVRGWADVADSVFEHNAAVVSLPNSSFHSQKETTGSRGQDSHMQTQHLISRTLLTQSQRFVVSCCFF